MNETPGAVSDEQPIKNLDGEARHSSHLVTGFVAVSDLKPLPGDLIEFSRELYSHWALYVGDGQVVNVRGRQLNSDVSFSGNASVKLEQLAVVAGESKCRINNQEAEATARGLQALNVKELMEKARNLVGETVPYHLLNKNCEHYVTEWRYGKSWSEQVCLHSIY
jgi:cell wall-associated NlpC family hydrolase